MVGFGGKNKKKGKKFVETERELTIKEEGEEYAQVIRLIGDSRLEVQCSDGVKRGAHIRGTLRKKVFINIGDIILVAIREFEQEKCDVILKYKDDEIRKLKKAGEIPENFKSNEETTETNNVVNEDDDIFVFTKKEKDTLDEDDDEEDEKHKKHNDEDDNEDEDEEGEDDEDEDIEEEEKDEEIEEEEEEEEEEVKTKYAKDKRNKTQRQQGNDKKRIIDDL